MVFVSVVWVVWSLRGPIRISDRGKCISTQRLALVFCCFFLPPCRVQLFREDLMISSYSHLFLTHRTEPLSRIGHTRGKKEAIQILNGSDYAPISPLLALSCECRCKTALVTNTPLHGWSLRQLDKSGFGVHSIQGMSTALGLLLLGRVQLSADKLWDSASHPLTLKQINPIAAEKIVHRLKLFRQLVLSVVAKSTAFNTFSQSVVLYTTSYFGAASADLKLLRTAAVDILLGRSWIRQDFLAYVFRWCKIAPLLDP